MEEKWKIIRTKCEICGKTKKKILRIEDSEEDYINSMYKRKKDVNGKETLICPMCENFYRITGNYEARGYGYKGATFPRKTVMDTSKTPTYGIEMEVAGNIKCIDKLTKLAGDEFTVGYDTSVEGAMFELSFSPGTYYWYAYESNLNAICKMLRKDKWVKDSDTIGMHIHIGGINKEMFMKAIIYEIVTNETFWDMMRVFGERRLNRYCNPTVLNGHHDAISWSLKWGTIEFRIFNMTYDITKILNRIKFLRQIIDNATTEGVAWHHFKNESKEYFLKLLKESKALRVETKEKIKKLFENGRSIEMNEDQKFRYERLNERLYDYVDREDRGRWNNEEEEQEEEYQEYGDY